MTSSTRRPRPRRPHTPSTPASHTRNDSPPLSPSTSLTTSDEEHLEGSYLLVGEEDETASTVGSSMRDSIIGELLSDSSDEHTRELEQDKWDAGTDDEDALDDIDPFRIQALVMQPPFLAGGSYADAEATMSELADSRSTLSQPLSSSQIRLIMPDPSASFSSSTISDTTTPSGPLGDLLAVPDQSRKPPSAPKEVKGGTKPRSASPKGRGVDKSWLEASSKLWNVPPDMSSVAIGVKTEGEYALLASTEDVGKGRSQTAIADGELVEKAVMSKFVQMIPNVVGTGNADDRDMRPIWRLTSAKTWSKRASILALASIVSVIFFRSFGPFKLSPSTSHVNQKARPVNPPVPTAGRAFSIWDHFALSPLTITPTGNIAPQTTASSSRLPDWQIIRQARSGFSTKSVQADFAESVTTSKSPKRRSIHVRDPSCCALSVRNNNVGLTMSGKHDSSSSSSTTRRWKRKLRGSAEKASGPFLAQNQSAHESGCPCHVSPVLHDDVFRRFATSVTSSRDFINLASQHLYAIYAPALAELDKELGELLMLVKTLAETTSTVAQFIIRRAARGVGVSRRALEHASSRVRDRIPPLPARPSVDHVAIARARAGMDKLSAYIEDQASVLADYVEEQSVVMHDKGLDSLKQAKRGLDKLLAEARSKIEADIERVTAFVDRSERRTSEQLADVSQKRSFRSMIEERKKGEGGRGRGGRETARISEPEKPSKMKRIFDAIHHGATAFVLY